LSGRVRAHAVRCQPPSITSCHGARAAPMTPPTCNWHTVSATASNMTETSRTLPMPWLAFDGSCMAPLSRVGSGCGTTRRQRRSPRGGAKHNCAKCTGPIWPAKRTVGTFSWITLRSCSAYGYGEPGDVWRDGGRDGNSLILKHQIGGKSQAWKSEHCVRAALAARAAAASTCRNYWIE
jgi:hypothetical protein